MLIHRLALRLGKSLDELEQTMDEEEFHRWMVFDAIEPIGDRRHDVLAGYICATNVAGKPSDFMPQWDHWIEAAAAEQAEPTPDAPSDGRSQQEILEEIQMIAFRAEAERYIRLQGEAKEAAEQAKAESETPPS